LWNFKQAIDLHQSLTAGVEFAPRPPHSSIEPIHESLSDSTMHSREEMYEELAARVGDAMKGGIVWLVLGDDSEEIAAVQLYQKVTGVNQVCRASGRRPLADDRALAPHRPRR
jgi:hypothetical protein